MARATLYGISVSSGLAIGNGFVLGRVPAARVRHELVPVDRVDAEAERLREAIEKVAAGFAEARACVPEGLSVHAEVLDSHLMICKDPKIGGEALSRIRAHRMNAEWALEESVARIVDAFRKIPSPYIRDRIEDVRIVSDRILQALAGEDSVAVSRYEKGILLAHNLSPADVIGLSLKNFFSFAIEKGGKTSHTGILARSLRIPAVVGVTGLCQEMQAGETLIVDAFSGKVLLGPTEAELAAYAALQKDHDEYQQRIHAYAAYPAESEDGLRVAVLANIENVSEAENVLLAGGEGVGLVRTEFGYITRATLPSEDELFREYALLAAKMAPRKVTFRTLDVGAEKILVGRKPLEEPNPALGVRAIRYCIRHQDIFRAQLRAILRASVHGNVALMFPLISDLTEFRIAKSILNQAMQDLDSAKVPFNSNMPVGILVELPSAVLMADVLAREVDFFSIGTNDLIQYALGVDRGNHHVAHMHQPLHPAIIRGIKQTVDMAHEVGISVGVCGEMAADPYCLPILLGMAVDELSLAPQSIPAIKHLIRRSNAQECRELLSHALAAPTTRVITNMMRQAVFSRFPEDVSFFVSQMNVNL